MLCFDIFCLLGLELSHSESSLSVPTSSIGAGWGIATCERELRVRLNCCDLSRVKLLDLRDKGAGEDLGGDIGGGGGGGSLASKLLISRCI